MLFWLKFHNDPIASKFFVELGQGLYFQILNRNKVISRFQGGFEESKCDMFGRFLSKMGGSGHFRATLPLLLHGNQKNFYRESWRGDTDELESKKKKFGYLLQLFPEVNFSVFLNFWGKPHCNPVGGGRGKKPFFQYFPIFSIHSDPNKNGFFPLPPPIGLQWGFPQKVNLMKKLKEVTKKFFLILIHLCLLYNFPY